MKKEQTDAMQLQSPEERPGTLLVIATPIGNLGDISQRALEALSSLDLLATESTTSTRRLFSAFQLPCPRLESFREENREHAEKKILESLSQGLRVGLTCEAGTPAISDPGWTLVRACHQAGFQVSGVPGASSIILALSLAGQPTRQFYFEVFLPRSNPKRRERLDRLGTAPETTVILESPHGLQKTLTDLLTVRPPSNPFTVLRELTKKFEEICSGTLQSCHDTFNQQSPRGEFVLVLGPSQTEAEAQPFAPLVPAVEWLREQGLSSRQLLSYMMQFHGLSRKEAYILANSVESRGNEDHA
jgi:16S rRNA (cytidine1402-2'-O)-methyltransferase